MQRAAASTSNRTNPTSSPLSSSSPPNINDHPVKRPKLSPSLPRSLDSNISTPQSLYQSDDPTTPLTQETKGFNPQNYAENAAETPWVLNIPIGSKTAQDESPLEEAVIGRRTFGDFKKKKMAEQVGRNTGEDDAESLSSAEDEGYEQYGDSLLGRTQHHADRGKKRKDVNDDRIDRIYLKKLKNGGISASAGMRQQGFDAKKYKKDKRKR